MGYEIHEKATRRGPRFRVWDTRSGGYWHPPLTKAELQDALLVAAVDAAVGDVMQKFGTTGYGTPLRTVGVRQWNRQPNDENVYPDGYFENRMAEIYGAKISIDIQNAPDGTKTITVKVEPLPKK